MDDFDGFDLGDFTSADVDFDGFDLTDGAATPLDLLLAEYVDSGQLSEAARDEIVRAYNDDAGDWIADVTYEAPDDGDGYV